MRYKYIFLIFCLSSISFSSLCGSELIPPHPKKYFSRDSTFCFTVIPKMTDSDVKFIETGDCIWDYDLRNSHVVLARNDTCRGIFSKHINDTTDSVIWNKPIKNLYAPEVAYVFQNGNYVITLDNWGYNGYGAVIVVYSRKGSLYRNYTLESFLPEKIIKKNQAQFQRRTSLA